MKHSPLFIPKVIFYTLVGIFILMIIFFVGPLDESFRRAIFPVMAVLGIIFFGLGIALIVVTLKKKVKGHLKTFFLLTGGSSALFLVSILLHNIVYGLFIVWFGEDFWERTGVGDEPFFFILALIVCPIAFLIGMIGSTVLLIKKR